MRAVFTVFSHAGHHAFTVPRWDARMRNHSYPFPLAEDGDGHRPPLPPSLLVWLRACPATLAALLPVPLVFALYAIDGLILPAIILGGHSCLAFALAGISGMFLCAAARERVEPHGGLLVVALVGNILCAAAAFCFMFRLHEAPEDTLRARPSSILSYPGR